MVITMRPDTTPTYKVGDYVILKDPDQSGIVYKVDEARLDERYPSLSNYKLRPVYGAFGAADKRGNRHERAEQMVKVDVVRAGLEHLKLLDFIKNLTKHEAGE